jgi:hypothetical protein
VTRLEGHGISLDLPTGWEGRIEMREPEVVAADIPPATTGALVHTANFALPADAGDFGSGAVEIMRTTDLLVVLFEYDRSSASTAMFAATGVPRFAPSDFSPTALQRVLPGQGGSQRFFNEAGRALCAYVVLGSYARRFGTVPLVNDVLATVRIT